jgi:recombination protein RecR
MALMDRTRTRKAAEAGTPTPQGPAGPCEGGARTAYPAAVERLIAEFANLPGVGRRSAERLAFYILKSDEATAMGLARAIHDVKKLVKHCRVCSNLSDDELCAVCADPRRDRTRVLVVEQPKDLIALEQTGMYRGLYHVLMGRLSPLDGIGPGDLTVDDLLRRIEKPEGNPGGTKVEEVILGLNPTVEGDGTSMYLAEHLRTRGVRVSRLARGLPTGSSLEFANRAVLADAIQGRQSME